MNLNRKSMFSFHQMNLAKSWNLFYYDFVWWKILKGKISLDLIKPWQTLGCCGSQESWLHLNFKFITGTSCSLFYTQTANGAITISNTNWATLWGDRILIVRDKVTFVFFFLLTLSWTGSFFTEMVVFEIAIPIVILRNTEVIKLSANNCWGWCKNNKCWNLLLHAFQLTWQCYGS